MEQFAAMGDENLNISDVIEVIQNDEKALGNDEMPVETEEEIPKNSLLPLVQPIRTKHPRPYIEIVEQPGSGIRFRYEIEGRSAGSIPGENSKPDLKTYPTIRIVGYKGKMLVCMSCVTVEKNPNNPPRPHPHKLVGRTDQCINGVCRLRLRGDNMTVSFQNVGIQCAKRKGVEASLTEREREGVDPFNTGFDHKKNHANLVLNAVRLCFQAFIPRKVNGENRWEALDPVVSVPIIEKKATCTLSITALSHCCAPVAGGMPMILLCDKVPKDDIQIRFFEERDGLVIWEGYGDFQSSQVHHQYAISFRTPKYDNVDITEPVKVKIQLKLKSKNQYGPERDFEMLPLGTGRPAFWSLRKAFARKKTDYNTFDKILSADPNPLFPHSNLRTLRNIDEFNNNDFNLKRSQDKFSALRALNDLYNVRNSIESQNGNVEMRSTLKQDFSKNIPQKNVNLESDEISIISVKNPNENRPNISRLETLQNSNQVRNVNLENNHSNVESNPRSDWFNNSEVGKWIQKSQEFQKSEEVKIDNQHLKCNDDGSLNELLSEVAELDQIYADTHAKLLDSNLKNSNGKEMEIDVKDNMTYTSLQMAMKNPIDLFDLNEDSKKYDDVPICSPVISIAPPPLAPKRDVTSEFEERLPPLPPKRIRKTPSMPVLPRSGAFQTPMEIESTFGAPNKNLPSPPGTLPKQAKQGLFSKLFAKKQKKEKDTCVTPTGSNRSLDVTESISSLRNDELNVHQLPRPSMASVTSVRSLRLDGDESPPYGVELTEAENYALYTAMAPHATTSEFDEMSFYYSPVEGGKILTKEI